MLYLAIGVVGFVAIVLYDLAQLRGYKVVAAALSSIGYLSIVASMIFLMITVRPPRTSSDLLALKALIATLAFVLLVYSVVIELPLARRRHPSDAGRKVLAVGFYRIVRHPGFLWFVLLWVSLAFIYENLLVTGVALCLIALDFGLVTLEDLVLFPRMLVGYDAYKRRVPFLIPHLRRKTNDVHL